MPHQTVSLFAIPTTSKTASCRASRSQRSRKTALSTGHRKLVATAWPRSEEHTSELQSRFDLVCRLLREKKKRIEIRELVVNAVAIDELISSGWFNGFGFRFALGDE